MTPPFIIADAKLQAQLEQAGGPVPICTPDGRVLAYASPAKSARLKLEPQISEEEIQRRLADTTSPRYPTEEVLKRLRSL